MTQLVKTAFNNALRQSPKLLNCAEGQAICCRTVITSSSSSATKANPKLEHRSDSEQETKWLFPIYKEMESMAFAHKYGGIMTGATCRYNTVKPLRTEHVEKALYHMQRKLPNFLCYIKPRENQLWVCEHPNPEIDFKVVEGVDSKDVVDQFCNTPFTYDSTPMLRTRLIQVSEDSPITLPEIKAAYPYQYDFIISAHHSFIDGYTMAFTLQKLVELLNDVIAGKLIDDSKPFGIYVSNKDVQEIDLKIMRELEKDPVRLQSMKKDLIACDSSPILLKGFPAPGGIRSTKHIVQDINHERLQQFTANCKKAGVTFTSGLEAIINTAMVEMVRDAGVDDDAHHLSVNLATDLRRYKKRQSLPILGLHVRPIVHRVKTKHNVRDNFWEYTHVLNSKLSMLIKSGATMNQYAVRQMTMPQINFEDHYSGNPPVVRDYGLSNIGDLTKVIPGEGDHLQHTELVQFTSVQRALFMMLHQIYTFRGHSPYTISYDTSYMSDDTANLLMDRIMHLLKHFSQ